MNKKNWIAFGTACLLVFCLSIIVVFFIVVDHLFGHTVLFVVLGLWFVGLLTYVLNKTL